MQTYKKIYIEITNLCDLNCPFCHRTKKQPRTMSIHEFEQVLMKIKDATEYIYLHVQGEPLLHPNLKELLELCNKYQKKVNLVTNGTLISNTKEVLLQASALRQVAFSLHSYQGEYLNQYLEPIFSATDAFIKQGIIVSYRFWNEDLQNHNDQLLNRIKQHYQIDQIFQNSTAIRKNLYLNRCTSFTWPTLEIKNRTNKGTCYGTRTHIAILVDGTIVPCCLDKDGMISLGNIFQDDLETVQKSEKYQRLYCGFQRNIKEEELCKCCQFLSSKAKDNKGKYIRKGT